MRSVLGIGYQTMKREPIDDIAPAPSAHVPSRFEMFYRDEYTSVVALTFARSGSVWAAEDLAQEAFLRAHRDWEHVSGLDSPEAWVRRVAMNLTHSRFRRLRSEAAAFLRLAGDAQSLEPLDPRDEAFWREVRRLPRRQADALTLYYVDDMPVSEIATIMSAADGTVRALLHQGRTRLKRQLAAKGWFA